MARKKKNERAATQSVLELIGNQGFHKEQKSILMVLLSAMTICWTVNFAMDVTTRSMLQNMDQIYCENETMVLINISI